MSKNISIICLLIAINSCKPQYYTVPVKDFAEQLSKLDIVKTKKPYTNLSVPTFKSVDDYVNNLQKLYVYDKEGKGDSVYLRGALVRYYTKNGDSGYSPIKYEIVRDNYFMVIEDSLLTIRPKCTYCKIPVDSVVKVVIKN